MPSVSGIFKVVSREHYAGGPHVLVKLESTQVTSAMFAARMELMVTSAEAQEKFAMGAELVVEFLQASKKI